MHSTPLSPLKAGAAAVNVVRHWPDVPVLYSFRRCPFAMRARLALVAAGQRVHIREVVLRNKPAHMLELSPKGTVPVLWLPNGQVLEQSLDILHWALSQSDPHGLLDLTAEQQQHAQAIVAELDGPFKHHLDRYKYPERYQTQEPAFVREAHLQAALRVLRGWNARLAEHLHLLGDRQSWVDLAVLPFVRQFRMPNPEWFDSELSLAALSGTLQRFVAHPWFEQAMVKLEPWAPEDAPVVFPAG